MVEPTEFAMTQGLSVDDQDDEAWLLSVIVIALLSRPLPAFNF